MDTSVVEIWERNCFDFVEDVVHEGVFESVDALLANGDDDAGIGGETRREY